MSDYEYYWYNNNKINKPALNIYFFMILEDFYFNL